MATAAPVLYHLQISHYNEKARWALDYKGVAHVRRAPPPMMHTVWAYAMTRGATFPVLAIDGQKIGDSTWIIEALERRYPEPPLYPAGEAERRRALELEDFFDEELGPHIRRAMFAEMTRDKDAMALAAAPRAGRAAHMVWRATAPAAAPILRLRFGINPDTAQVGRAKTLAALDRVSSELESSGYLVGDGFTVADLTAAALLMPLVRPPEAEYLPTGPYPAAVDEWRESASTHPAFEWVEDMYRRHRGASAEIAG
jgi:glutathione S-transferase